MKSNQQRLIDLKHTMRNKIADMRKITDQMKAEGRGSFKDAKEEKRFNNLDDEIEKMQSEAEKLQRIVDSEARGAAFQAPAAPQGAKAPDDSAGFMDGNGVRSQTNLTGDKRYGDIVARTMIAMKSGNQVRDSFGAEVRDITASSGSAMIQNPSIQNSIIYSLMSNNPLVKCGASFFDTTNHAVFPKVQAYPSVTWMTPGAEVQASEPTIGAVKFDLKDIACLVRVDNNVLYDSTPDAASVIQETINRAINQALLEAAFAGTGTNGQPAGLDNMTGVQSLSHANGTIENYGPLIAGAKELMKKNVSLNDMSVILSPDVWEALTILKATDDQPLMKPLDLGKMAADERLYVTTAVKDNYGTDGDQSRIYMGDFSQLAFGLGGPFSLTLSERYSTHLQTGFLVHMRVDIQSYMADNFVIIKDITV